jgi:hypothetical protein
MRSYLSPFVVAIQRSARASRAARAKWMKLLERLPIFSLPEAQGLVESGVSILIPPQHLLGLDSGSADDIDIHFYFLPNLITELAHSDSERLRAKVEDLLFHVGAID